MLSPAPDADIEAKGLCHICLRGEEYESVLTCNSCQVTVHGMCYGVPPNTVPSPQWRCSPCSRGLAPLSQACSVCPNRKDRALKPTTDDRWIHVSCAMWFVFTLPLSHTLSLFSFFCIIPNLILIIMFMMTEMCVLCQADGSAVRGCAAERTCVLSG